jgi:quercetin dioxygenase-like cupin family protein
MALPHAGSGELIDVRPLGSQLTSAPSRAILKTSSLELMRMVMPAGRTVAEHRVSGECTIQCIEGSVELTSHGKTQLMRTGDLVYFEGGVVHALHAQEDSSLLVTILLRHED